MALFIEHVNVCLNRMREPVITALSTDGDSEAYKAQIAARRAVSRVWNYKQWTFKQRETDLSVASGTRTDELPKDVGEPYLVKSSVSPYILRPVDQKLFDERLPNPTASGDPKAITIFTHLGVSSQPSAASTLAVVSSSASDTTQKVVIKGLVSGQEDVEEVTLLGTTTVNTSKSFSKVLSISKSASTAGRVTISAGSTTVLIMAPYEKTSRLRKFTIDPSAGSALTLTFKHYALPPVLSTAYEDTEIPERWDYVVDQFAFAFMLQTKGNDQLEEMAAQMNLANTFLADMNGEEMQSSQEPIIPLRMLDSGEDIEFSWVPDGFGVTY